MKGGDEIETNVEIFLKNSIALSDIYRFPNVLLFLKIATKWREFQKSKLNKELNFCSHIFRH